MRAELDALGEPSEVEEQLQVVGIKDGKPWSAHTKLEKLFQQVSGMVRICDPYYGTGSLARLILLRGAGDVRFLTQTPDSKEKAALPRLLREFKQEHPHVEFRQHSGKGLHDRYLVTDDVLILLGHGLKDIGNSESFVVRLDKSLVPDLVDDVVQSFDQKWAAATVLA